MSFHLAAWVNPHDEVATSIDLSLCRIEGALDGLRILEDHWGALISTTPEAFVYMVLIETIQTQHTELSKISSALFESGKALDAAGLDQSGAMA